MGKMLYSGIAVLIHLTVLFASKYWPSENICFHEVRNEMSIVYLLQIIWFMMLAAGFIILMPIIKYIKKDKILDAEVLAYSGVCFISTFISTIVLIWLMVRKRKCVDNNLVEMVKDYSHMVLFADVFITIIWCGFVPRYIYEIYRHCRGNSENADEESQRLSEEETMFSPSMKNISFVAFRKEGRQ